MYMGQFPVSSSVQGQLNKFLLFLFQMLCHFHFHFIFRWLWMNGRINAVFQKDSKWIKWTEKKKQNRSNAVEQF